MHIKILTMYTPQLQTQVPSGSRPATGATTSGKSGTPAILKKIKQLVADRDIDQAKSLLEQAIEQDSGNATFLLIMSKLLTMTKDYDSALTFVQRAIKADPLNAVALLQQGTIKFRKSDYKGALESVAAALSLDSRSLKSFHLQQRTYGKLADYDQLIASCDQCLSMYPFDDRSYINKSTAFTKQDRLKEAEELINNATLMVSDSSALYLELGGIYSLRGQHSKAIIAYQKSVTNQKSSRPPTHLKLAKSFLEVADYNQFRESLAEYDRALRGLKRKALSKRLKNRYQYTYDFLFACSLKEQSNIDPYKTAVTAILRRMLVDNNTLHGVLNEPLSPDAIQSLPFERVEELIVAAVKTFEEYSQNSDDDSFSDLIDDEA
jgi:tetratricopeptide (TPR) repeat protein